MSFDKYDFDFMNLYELLNKRNIWDIIYHHKRLNDILSEQKIKPDIILTPSTFDNYVKFVNGHIQKKTGNVFVNYWYVHIMMEVIVNNLYINCSTEFYYKIKESIGLNPSFMDEIFLNNIPKYEIKVFFNGIRAERDLYDILYKNNMLAEYKFNRVME